MSTLLVVNGAPYGSEAPYNAFHPAEDDLVDGVHVATTHDLAAAVACSQAHLRF